MKAIRISSALGHEIMALNFAKAKNLKVVIIPNKELKEDYESEASMIFANLSFFYNRLEIVPFEKRENYKAWDIIADLKKGVLPDASWEKFAKTMLVPVLTTDLPAYKHLDANSVLFVPQKLISDVQCNVTAAQQSLPMDVFSFLKDSLRWEQLVLGQHFHKVNDNEMVEKLVREFDLYVPGRTENEQVYGIRGVDHREYYNMYRHLIGSIGIAGTHTWIMLTVFPNIPQIILYNKKGVENWSAIEKAYQAQGYDITCMGFDEDTDMQEFSKEIEKKYYKILKCI